MASRALLHILTRLSVPVLSVIVFAGCPKVPQQTTLMTERGIEASATELRARMGEYGRRFAAYLEVSADSVIAATTDKDIQRAAILYKLSAIPAAHDAALRQDPLLAGWDTWALLRQLEAFAASDNGQRVFGEHNGLILGGIAQASAIFDELADAVTRQEDQDSTVDAAVQAWADAHPIEDVPFIRPSIIGEAAGFLGGSGGLGSAFVGLEGSLDRLEQRVAYMSETGMKQAVWVGQIAVRSGLQLDEVTRFFDLMDASTRLLDSLPDYLIQHRVALIEAIGVERFQVLADIERIRNSTIDELRTEREIILNAIAAERAIVMNQLSSERAAVMAGMDSLASRVMDRQYEVIDRVFWRLLQVAVVLGVLALIWTVILLRLIRK